MRRLICFETRKIWKYKWIEKIQIKKFQKIAMRIGHEKQGLHQISHKYGSWKMFWQRCLK